MGMVKFAIGQVDLARKLARFSMEEIGTTPSYDFLNTVYEACDRAILGQDEKARDALRRAQKGRRLVWEPMDGAISVGEPGTDRHQVFTGIEPSDDPGATLDVIF